MPRDNNPGGSPEKPLRVLVLDPSGLLWGSERALLDLLRHVDASRFDVRVLSPRGMPFPALLADSGIAVVEGPIGMLHRKGAGARLIALAWLASKIFTYRPDVIHVNEAGATALASAARAGRRTPVVAHVRLWDDAVVLGRSGRRASGACMCIAVSNFVGDKLRKGPHPSGDVRVVYDPFDAVAFGREAGAVPAPQPAGTAPRPRTVLMVGRICREKGQELLLDAAEHLDDPSIRFLVAGGVPPGSPAESAYLEALVARVNANPLRGRVELLGNRADVAGLMKASDVVVLASENEPFGRVLLEALSLGIPVIAPGRGGPAEILGNGERGTLFEAGSAESLASAINQTLADPTAERAKAERGREWVLRECAPRQHAERIQALWKEVAANPKVRG